MSIKLNHLTGPAPSAGFHPDIKQMPEALCKRKLEINDGQELVQLTSDVNCNACLQIIKKQCIRTVTLDREGFCDVQDRYGTPWIAPVLNKMKDRDGTDGNRQ